MQMDIYGKHFCKNAILLETKYGSHSTFLSMFGGFYLDNIILEYMQTMYEISQTKVKCI